MSTALLISGGVDSAVALHLLVEQGVRPDLFYIKIAPEGDDITCSAEEDIELSTATARRYGLHLEVVDLSKAYEERVTAYVVDRVLRGLTPNPDVMCNRFIKFGAFNEVAGASYSRIATGHYARRVERSEGLWIGPAPDPVKDQSDFLSQLSPEQAQKALFPLGDLKKEAVRRIAEEVRLPSARRKDSQGICFLGKINYAQYLTRLLGERDGAVVEIETGREVGRHKGYWMATIGQRKGLGLGGGPWFVVAKDVEKNILYVSHGYTPEKAWGTRFTLGDFHFVTSDPWASSAPWSCDAQEETPILFKIRHTETPQRATLRRTPDGLFHITAQQPVQGIAPGQFGVLYTADGEVMAGSGEIVHRPAE